MANNRELSQFGSYVTVNQTDNTVGVGTSVILTGGVFVGGVQAIRPDGTWGGSSAGIQGAQGTQGLLGVQGVQGTQGVQGIQGITGAQGATGSQGTTGVQGATGSQGTQGASGPSTTINATDDTTDTSLFPVMVTTAGSNQTAQVASTRNFIYNASTGSLGLGQSPSFTLDVNGTTRAERYRGINSLVLNSYQTVNPASNVFLYSQPNDRDSWIYLDSADTGSNWGIYHRQIDSTVSGLPGNSIGFIGGGTNTLQSYISLANGNAYFAGTLQTNNIQTTTGKPILNSTGSILQIVQTVKTDTFTTTSARFVDITGMSCSITPGSSSSKILVLININGSGTPNVTNAYVRLLRNGNLIFAGDAAGSRVQAFGGMYVTDGYAMLNITATFLDSPATTSSVTYKLQTGNEGSGTVFVNRTQIDRDPTDGRGASSITLVEVSA